MELFFVIFLQIFCLYQLFLTSFLLYRNIKNNKHKLLTFYRDTKEVIVVQYRLAKNHRTKKYKNRKQEYYNRLSSYNCKEGISYFSIPHFFCNNKSTNNGENLSPIYQRHPHSRFHFYCQSFSACTMATNIIFM